MRALRLSVLPLLLFGALLSFHAASAQFMQQGPKLVGTDAKKPSEQGKSVALSADGNTAIVGGWRDNFQVGAAWVYTRSGDVWTQQGAKLVGAGAGGGASQGYSVALSADGNTAIVGGITDSDFLPGAHGANVGAAWVFTRSGGVWTQQGAKLVGVGGAADFVYQGASVALSANGNTAIVGGYGDSGIGGATIGAAWVFTRSGGAWTQQGAKLVGAGAVGNACQGQSVALSADGNTAIVGGGCDNGNVGAAWIFARNGGTWTQQGTKLVGIGVAGTAVQSSVSLSADGNTAIVGGSNDNGIVGAAWVYVRSGDVWTQQGPKLVGTGAAGAAAQGLSVSLSADGNTAIVGGVSDNQRAGAAWVFTRSGGVWTQDGPKLVGSGAAGAAFQGYSVALSADGKTAIVGGAFDLPSVDQYGGPTGTGAAWVFTRAGMPPVTTLDLNQHGLTGSWYNPATSGQGIEIEVFPNPSSGTGSAFVSWFTYDTVIGGAERQRWYTAQGQVVTGQPNVSLMIFQNVGGNFNAPPVTNAQAVGTATLSFDTCTSGQLVYNFTDGTGRSGTMPLARLTQNVTCSGTTPHPTNADFAFSGNWYAAATSGQGLTVEVNPNSSTVFAAWYTYAPEGASAGAPGQRWYTVQPTTFTPGMRSIPVTIYETTGGIFDTPTPPGQKSVAVGSGTLAFQGCSAATLSYNFAGGSNSGLSGIIALSRIGPVPAGCTS